MLEAIATQKSAEVASALTQAFSGNLANFAQSIVDSKDQEYRIYSVAVLNQIATSDSASVKAAIADKISTLEQGASSLLAEKLNKLK